MPRRAPITVPVLIFILLPLKGEFRMGSVGIGWSHHIIQAPWRTASLPTFYDRWRLPARLHQRPIGPLVWSSSPVSGNNTRRDCIPQRGSAALHLAQTPSVTPLVMIVEVLPVLAVLPELLALPQMPVALINPLAPVDPAVVPVGMPIDMRLSLDDATALHSRMPVHMRLLSLDLPAVPTGMAIDMLLLDLAAVHPRIATRLLVSLDLAAFPARMDVDMFLPARRSQMFGLLTARPSQMLRLAPGTFGLVP
jgi:hypothetical protein